MNHLKEMKYSFPRLIILSVLFIIKINMTAQTNIDPSKALSQTIDGWKTSGVDRIFNEETLYDYIDGGAELFLSFGFTKVFNRIYSRDNQPDIIVDIFYMNTSYDAFGVFSHSVGKIENDFGQQSQRTKGAIVFWKNNFYISILSSLETEELKSVITEIALLLDKAIPEKGPLPDVLKYLPEHSLNKTSIHYFRHYVWLNSHCFISNENILNINQSTHGVLAQYSDKDDKAVLLIIEYPNSADASAAKEKFIKNYYVKLESSSILQMNNNKWVGIELINNFFVGVFNGTEEEFVKTLLSLTEETIRDF